MKFPDSSNYVDWYAFFCIFGRMCDIYLNIQFRIFYTFLISLLLVL